MLFACHIRSLHLQNAQFCLQIWLFAHSLSLSIQCQFPVFTITFRIFGTAKKPAQRGCSPTGSQKFTASSSRWGCTMSMSVVGDTRDTCMSACHRKTPVSVQSVTSFVLSWGCFAVWILVIYPVVFPFPLNMICYRTRVVDINESEGYCPTCRTKVSAKEARKTS